MIPAQTLKRGEIIPRRGPISEKTHENAEPGSSRYTFAMLLIRVKLSTPPPPPPAEYERPYLCDQHFSRSTMARLQLHGTLNSFSFAIIKGFI